jgi:uncharacterized protein
MRHQLPDNHGKPFETTGDGALWCLQSFVRENNILAAERISLFAQSTLGYVNWFTNVAHEQVEFASLLEDVRLSQSEEPILHIHVVVGQRDGAALAGHLEKARVRPTLEVILNEWPARLQQIHAPQLDLAPIGAK